MAVVAVVEGVGGDAGDDGLGVTMYVVMVMVLGGGGAGGDDGACNGCGDDGSCGGDSTDSKGCACTRDYGDGCSSVGGGGGSLDYWLGLK